MSGEGGDSDSDMSEEGGDSDSDTSEEGGDSESDISGEGVYQNVYNILHALPSTVSTA